jgi:acetyl esterase/lipase
VPSRSVPVWGPAHRAAGGPDTPAYAAPARVADPGGLPPAYIEVAQLDMFRDEDLAYALRLGQAGVPVEFHLHPGAPHEFDFIAFNTAAARRAIADRVLSSTGCPCPSPVAAVQPAMINDCRSVLAAQPAPIR